MTRIVRIGLVPTRTVFAVHGVEAGERVVLGRNKVLAREALRPAAAMLRRLEQKVEALDKKITAWGRSDKACRHLTTAPGYGPPLAGAAVAIVTNPGVVAA